MLQWPLYRVFSLVSKGKRGSAPGVTRTPDLRIRNPLLYPAELRAHLEAAERIATAGNRKPFCAGYPKLLNAVQWCAQDMSGVCPNAECVPLFPSTEIFC